MSVGTGVVVAIAVILLVCVSRVLDLRRERTKRHAQRDRWEHRKPPRS